uniref:Uncharacterized protein n=1 Tax=Chlamydomonas euryale TaxID=1486919 RepID=A0A7R9YQ90_9CHLO
MRAPGATPVPAAAAAVAAAALLPRPQRLPAAVPASVCLDVTVHTFMRGLSGYCLAARSMRTKARYGAPCGSADMRATWSASCTESYPYVCSDYKSAIYRLRGSDNG